MTDVAAQEFLKRRAAQERVAAKLAKCEHAQQSHAEMARRYQNLATRYSVNIERQRDAGVPVGPFLIRR